MKYIGIFDCGTTNSRFSIVDSSGTVVGKASTKIGVKDTAVQGSNLPLKSGLVDLYRDTLRSTGIATSEIALVISSGMITSELGLLELPHMPAPAGLAELTKGLTHLEGADRLAIEPELYLVRGVKNRPNPAPGSPVNAVRPLDFMRGEETQMMGFLSIYGGGIPTTVVNLSSHTKYINLDADGRIKGSVTTLSGQVYEAIVKETFIGKSVTEPLAGKTGAAEDSGTHVSGDVLKEAMDSAYEIVRTAGLLRSLVVPRFMDTLMSTDWRIRRRFVESCLIADDLSAMNLFPEYGFDRGSRVVLVGLPERCAIFEYLFRKSGRAEDAQVMSITDPDAVNDLAVTGALAIARGAGLI
jgi:2-dehydro-3-deoxygalactonokinase